MMRRRRPIARTAVIGGAAYAGGKHMANKSAAEEARMQDVEAQTAANAQAEAQPAPNGGDDKIEQLTRLGELHTNGILTDEEFSAEKAKILNS
jgi:hypothetical protein